MKPEIEQLIIEWAEMEKEIDKIKEEIQQRKVALRDTCKRSCDVETELQGLCENQLETFGLKVDRDTFVVVSYFENDAIKLEIVDFENRRNDGERSP